MIALRCCAISVLVTLVSCATTHSSMTRSAANLGSSAYVFVNDTDGSFPHAAELISQSNHFIDTVDHAGDREVLSAYEPLWNAYQALRIEVERSGSPGAQASFKPVTQAFAHVALNIRGYADADGSVYARGGFPHDPYYDP